MKLLNRYEFLINPSQEGRQMHFTYISIHFHQNDDFGIRQCYQKGCV